MTDRSPTVTGQSLSAWRPDAFSCESADTVGQPPRALTVPRALVVISFDIDGTMEFGDPPGPVSASIARELVDRGVHSWRRVGLGGVWPCQSDLAPP